MSGIYGIINLKKEPIDPTQMNRMEELLIHRGVDGKAQWIEGHVGLGHLKLEVTPESEYESLPLRYKQWVITADARIDNRDELDDPLSISKDDRPFTPDTTYIIKAYEKWGKDCVKHLIGDFAFAIWDIVENTLFCARDHIGIKPFFYLKTEDKFIFASELKTIVESINSKFELDEAKLGDFYYLIQDLHEPEKTLVKGIKRLLAAQTGMLIKNELLLHKYWQLSRTEEIVLSSDTEYIEEFKRLIIKAIECRMRTNHPIGITLSGGLDSSSIACIAARILNLKNKNLYAVSSVLPENWEGPEQDEREYIEEVLKQEKNIKINYVSAQDKNIFGEVKQNSDNLYFPMNVYSFMDSSLKETLKSNGNIRTILNGFTGDMAVSINVSSLLFVLFKQLKWKTVTNLILKKSKIEQRSIFNILLKDVLKYVAPNFILRLRLFLLKKNYNDKLSSFLNKNFIKKYSLTRKSRQHPFVHSDIHQFIISMFNACLTNFEERNIKYSHHQIEDVIPFADIRLLNFLMNIPFQYLHLQGWNRGLIRYAMANILPSKIQWRQDKQIYTPDFNRRILNEKDIILKRIHTDSDYLNKYLDIKTIESKLGNIIIYKNWSAKNYDSNLMILGHILIVCETGKIIKNKFYHN